VHLSAGRRTAYPRHYSVPIRRQRRYKVHCLVITIPPPLVSMHASSPSLDLMTTTTTTTGCEASYEWGHVSPVHLARGDLLLGQGHGAQVEVLRPAHRPGADDPGQRHRAVLQVAHAVELLLQDGGPAGGEDGDRSGWECARGRRLTCLSTVQPRGGRDRFATCRYERRRSLSLAGRFHFRAGIGVSFFPGETIYVLRKTS